MENKGKGLSGMNRMGMIIAGSVFLTFALFTSASSRPYRLAKLPDKGKNFGCSTCHINPNGGGPRNTFGEDYRKIAIPNGDQYTDELGKRDSDGDSFDNNKEFSSGTRPGDAGSKPAQ
jgi:hypothetical protein